MDDKVKHPENTNVFPVSESNDKFLPDDDNTFIAGWSYDDDGYIEVPERS